MLHKWVKTLSTGSIDTSVCLYNKMVASLPVFVVERSCACRRVTSYFVFKNCAVCKLVNFHGLHVVVFSGEVKTLMIQLLRAVVHMHDNWILHRDIKASNLLLSNKGILKVGLCNANCLIQPLTL